MKHYFLIAGRCGRSDTGALRRALRGSAKKRSLFRFPGLGLLADKSGRFAG